MKIDPAYTFWISLVTTIMQGFATGTVHLTGLVPEYMIPVITGWMGVIVFINMSILTALSGFSAPKRGPLAPPPTVSDVRALMAEARKNGSPK